MPNSPKKTRRRHRRLPRTTILFFVGIGLIIKESVDGDVSMPMLATGLIMCGFPAIEIVEAFGAKALNALADQSSEADDDEEPS